MRLLRAIGWTLLLAGPSLGIVFGMQDLRVLDLAYFTIGFLPFVFYWLKKLPNPIPYQYKRAMRYRYLACLILDLLGAFLVTFPLVAVLGVVFGIANEKELILFLAVLVQGTILHFGYACLLRLTKRKD